MKFRYARHTNAIKPLVDFYTQIIGLEILGKFEKHSNYNGVFLGLKNLDWHLEFTESNEKVNHFPDEDDLIVFYINSKEELNSIIKNAKKLGFFTSKPKNPYWQENGIEIKDPDNFNVILTVKQWVLYLFQVIVYLIYKGKNEY